MLVGKNWIFEHCKPSVCGFVSSEEGIVLYWKFSGIVLHEIKNMIRKSAHKVAVKASEFLTSDNTLSAKSLFTSFGQTLGTSNLHHL